MVVPFMAAAGAAASTAPGAQAAGEITSLDDTCLECAGIGIVPCKQLLWLSSQVLASQPPCRAEHLKLYPCMLVLVGDASIMDACHGMTADARSSVT